MSMRVSLSSSVSNLANSARVSWSIIVFFCSTCDSESATGRLRNGIDVNL